MKSTISSTPIVFTMTALPDAERGERVKMFSTFSVTLKRNGTELDALRAEFEAAIKSIAKAHNARFDANHPH